MAKKSWQHQWRSGSHRMAALANQLKAWQWPASSAKNEEEEENNASIA